MISKKDIMLQLIDLECRIDYLEEELEKLNKPKRGTKKSVKVSKQSKVMASSARAEWLLFRD